MNRTNKVLLIYTGGTIGMGHNQRTGALEPLDFNHLVDNVPEFKLIPTEVDTYQFDPPIDSSDMSPVKWKQLVKVISDRYDEYDGFVVLHGTDTMSYTASALSFMFENLTKPIILHHADGTPIVPEVCVYFSGHLLRGNRSTKQNADEFNAFDSFNYPHLCEAGVNFNFKEHNILKPDFSKPMVPHFELDNNVIIFSLFPGIEEHLIRHTFDAPELRSIVMRSYGSGNAPQQPWLMNLLRKVTERDIIVVNISQCISGQVEMNRYDTGYQLKDAGVISGYDSTVEAAVTKLMFLQAKYKDTETIRKYMNQSIAGEITIYN